MTKVACLDLDLLVERGTSGYRTHVVSSPAGQASGEFVLSRSDPALDNWRRCLDSVNGGDRDVAARNTGEALFLALGSGNVDTCFRASLALAAQQQASLRIRLRLNDAPDLIGLPWELLYDARLGRFLALSSQTPVVRYLELPLAARPMVGATPLRILVLTAAIPGFPLLDLEREWAGLKDAVAPLERAGLFSVERLDRPSLSSLADRLRAGAYHVVHFAGHAACDPSSGQGLLAFLDEAGEERWESSDTFATLLADHPTLRVAVLNACDTARPFAPDVFASAGSSLARAGIPAVIAVQARIPDRAAVAFSRGFYGAIVEDAPIDVAVTEGRKSVLAAGFGTEWALPVLFLQAPDAYLFGLRNAGARRPAMGADELAGAVVAALVTGTAPARAVSDAVEERYRDDPYGAQVLLRLKSQPDSALRQSALTGLLTETFEADQAFMQRLEDLLSEGQPEQEEGISQRITISGQAHTGDLIQIGKVQGRFDVSQLFGRRGKK